MALIIVLFIVVYTFTIALNRDQWKEVREADVLQWDINGSK